MSAASSLNRVATIVGVAIIGGNHLDHEFRDPGVDRRRGMAIEVNGPQRRQSRLEDVAPGGYSCILISGLAQTGKYTDLTLYPKWHRKRGPAPPVRENFSI